ncbi:MULTISPECIES: hypothetical protein [Nostocaceae]|nr:MULTISPECIES: hypothetical protein [Nostocaceae]MBD2475145.1 hypothetical protein [Anabaena sp. FACHB-83]
MRLIWNWRSPIIDYFVIAFFILYNQAEIFIFLRSLSWYAARSHFSWAD